MACVAEMKRASARLCKTAEKRRRKSAGGAAVAENQSGGMKKKSVGESITWRG